MPNIGVGDFSEDLSPQFVVFERSTNSSDVRRQCFMIQIQDDSVYEGNETFEVELSLDKSTSSSVILDPSSTEVLILDDDGKSFT